MPNETKDGDFNDGVQITISPLLHDRDCRPTI